MLLALCTKDFSVVLSNRVLTQALILDLVSRGQGILSVPALKASYE